MATRETLFPSKYVKHADLNGQDVTVTIDSMKIEEVGMDRETKPVLSFKDAKKGLVLNMTNYDTIALAYGEETDNWCNQKITLYGAQAQFGGKIVDCIRVRPLASPPAEVKAEPETKVVDLKSELNDSIPF